MDLVAALALAGEGCSRRKIARILGVGRNTLKKYLPAPDRTGPAAEPQGKLARYHGPLEEMLRARPACRAVEVFRHLKAEGYSGGYDPVKRKVRALRRGKGEKAAPVPGERAQADLGKVEAGARTLFLFTLALDFSGRIYAELLERTDLDGFLDCHAKAFRYFQGVPAEIAYEKSRNRLLKALVGARGLNLPMTRFAGHYGFRAVEAPPTAPWSAGRLKRPLRMMETLFLKDYPLGSLEGANAALLGWLQGREGAADAVTVNGRFAREQAALRPLPKSGFARFRLKLQEKQEL
ncbi:MAG TPA: helix-turn-helix domain-containing protein [Fibrobacteria bacterium]|nr:helix-turn-helix domain-containing protein [Fibrobacteria bacterium]